MRPLLALLVVVLAITSGVASSSGGRDCCADERASADEPSGELPDGDCPDGERDCPPLCRTCGGTTFPVPDALTIDGRSTDAQTSLTFPLDLGGRRANRIAVVDADIQRHRGHAPSES